MLFNFENVYSKTYSLLCIWRLYFPEISRIILEIYWITEMLYCKFTELYWSHSSQCEFNKQRLQHLRSLAIKEMKKQELRVQLEEVDNDIMKSLHTLQVWENPVLRIVYMNKAFVILYSFMCFQIFWLICLGWFSGVGRYTTY